ncbi:MAG: 4Fe-4S binding protein [Rhodospirillales bacterium]|nr:4Fe-4S binding protein [Rhodospirillales bacterium]
MPTDQKLCLVCSCEGTLALDRDALAGAEGFGKLRFARGLCRDDADMLRDAIETGADVTVACTQEHPLFDEIFDDVMAEAAADADRLNVVNIRERAGWTNQAGDKTGKTNLTAKMAGLIAAAEVTAHAPPMETMHSMGELWILGNDDSAMEAAAKLAHRLDVTVLLTPDCDVIPRSRTTYPVYSGTVTGASGHFGAFQIDIKGMRAAAPSSRAKLEFTGMPQDGAGSCDLILDLRGEAALFPAPEKRDGYLNPDPGSPGAVGDALLKLVDMTGEFEKPRYISYDRNICAHSRSTIVGCSRCVDNCPTGAVIPDGDGVKYDPFVCAGCGSCASACPTGAAHYGAADTHDHLRRLRALLKTYGLNGGKTPIVLYHDQGFGAEALDMIARFGDGLAPHILPVELSHVTQIGLDTLLATAAYGAPRCMILAAPDDTQGMTVVDEQIALARSIFEGLGYTDCGITVIDETDPDRIAEALHGEAAMPGLSAATFEPAGRKRTVMRLALDHLHKNAPSPVDAIPLPAGAPFGQVTADTEKCTLCMSCVGACPSGAMRDNPDAPQLSFVEDACVQCGLCAKTCPEGALTLSPQLSFADDVRDARILNEEEPFHCISCGKAYTTQSTANRLIERLSGHSMFADPKALNRLKMCDDCRIIDMSESDENPLAMGIVPKTRTTADYLAGHITDEEGEDVS